MKVFIDANVLFSAAYSPAGTPGFILEHGPTFGLELWTCAYATQEAERNLGRKAPEALPAYLRLTGRLRICQSILEGATPPGLPAKDRPIWLSATALGAEILLSGDKKDFGPLAKGGPGPTVMTPRQLYLEMIA